MNYTTLKIKSLISIPIQKPLLECYDDKTDWLNIDVGSEFHLKTFHSRLNGVFGTGFSKTRTFSMFFLTRKSLIDNDVCRVVSSTLLEVPNHDLRQSQIKSNNITKKVTLGLDSEWVNRGTRNRIISYQIWCHEADQGLMIVCHTDTRWTWKAMVGLVRGVWGATDQTYVSHFNLAEVSAFADSVPFFKKLNGVHNVKDSILVDKGRYRLTDKHWNKTEILISLVDTNRIISSSLDAIARQMNFDKIYNPHITCMDKCLLDHPVFFLAYSMIDAMIVADFYVRLLQFTDDLKIKNITTGSQIGAKYALTKITKFDLGYVQQSKTFKTSDGVMKTVNVWKLPFDISGCIEGYHGARNETYVHGIYGEDWFDYDVTGAYANAMLMIQCTDWTSARHIADPAMLDPNDIGSMTIDFRFHDWVKYPNFPVERDSNLIFPMSGRTSVSPIDVWTAHKNGWLAYINIRHSVVFDKRMGFIFQDIIKTIQDGRAKFSKNDLLNLLWKLLGNGLYGKLAQGISQTTEYDLEASLAAGSPIRRSVNTGAIFNPAIASFITGALRSICSEYLNACGSMGIRVINNTTDGFQINSPLSSAMIRGEGMPVTSFFAAMRVRALGDTEQNRTIVELKHHNPFVHCESINIALQNRNYYMLSTEGTGGRLIARGGVSTRQIEAHAVTDYLLRHYLTASADTTSHKSTLSSLKDVMAGGDLISIESDVRKNYDFDIIKRRPIRESIERVDFEYCGVVYEKVNFLTAAWSTADEASKIAGLYRHWRESTNGEINKLQTASSMIAFLDYIDVYRYADTQASTLESVMMWKGVVYMSKCGYSASDISTALGTTAKSVHNIMRGKVAKNVITGDADFISVDRADKAAMCIINSIIHAMPVDVRIDAFNVLTSNPVAPKSAISMLQAVVTVK